MSGNEITVGPFRFPDQAIDAANQDPRLDGQNVARRVYSHIVSWGAATGECHRSDRQIADTLRVHPGSVARAIRLLDSLGYFARLRRGEHRGLASEYTWPHERNGGGGGGKPSAGATLPDEKAQRRRDPSRRESPAPAHRKPSAGAQKAQRNGASPYSEEPTMTPSGEENVNVAIHHQEPETETGHAREGADEPPRAVLPGTEIEQAERIARRFRDEYGAQLRWEGGDRIAWEVPPHLARDGGIPADRLDELRRHKPALLELLRRGQLTPRPSREAVEGLLHSIAPEDAPRAAATLMALLGDDKPATREFLAKGLATVADGDPRLTRDDLVGLVRAVASGVHDGRKIAKPARFLVARMANAFRAIPITTTAHGKPPAALREEHATGGSQGTRGRTNEAYT